MNVYHGSTEIVDKPLVNKGRKYLDFGQGFYVTNLREQAIDWATRPINTGRLQYLNIYDFDLVAIKGGQYRCARFDTYNDYWLDFVIANRHGDLIYESYDVVEGGIANDRIFNTIELYDAGLITREEALARLKYEKPNNQICIRNQEILDNHLHLIKSERLDDNEPR